MLFRSCHGQPNTSGYGIAWVSLTDEPGDYTSYVVTIDSVTLTRNDGAVVTAVGTPEVADMTQVHNIAELWSSGAIPEGTEPVAGRVIMLSPTVWFSRYRA